MRNQVQVLVLVAILIGVSASVSAEGPEPVLVPLLARESPGAFGSVWSTQLLIHNHGETPIAFGRVGCTLGFCSFYEVRPGMTEEPLQGSSEPYPFPGAFILLTESELRSLTFNLRVFDESRSEENWGVALPVVRFRDFTSGTHRLIGIPAGAAYRHTLRVYAFGRGLGTLDIAYFDDAGPSPAPVHVDRVPFQETIHGEGLVEYSWAPETGTGTSRLRVEVRPTNEDLPVWAMVSVTNNVTQSVFVITDDTNAPN